MKETSDIEEFKEADWTYKSRIYPEAIYHSIGKIVFNFSDLERKISLGIQDMLGVDDEEINIITSGLTYRLKLDLMSSLYHNYKSKRKFNVGIFDSDEYFKDLIKACDKCGELRNKIVHSSWNIEYSYFDWKSQVIEDKKVKRNKGLIKNKKEVTPAFLLDIADYFWYISTKVEGFFFKV
ncbi:hypothetical protein BMS3Bbin16_00783 [archaeon BMS3Bbin16]|nr:hypothetical protein BMS3Bbin16_00783 [archaeon BMS3Bbin16]